MTSPPLSMWRYLPVPVSASSMRAIAEGVADAAGLSLAELRTPTTVWRISHPRQDAMRAMYETGRYSNAQIAGFFGLSDHTTVVHARKQSVVRAKRKAEKNNLGGCAKAASRVVPAYGTVSP